MPKAVYVAIIVVIIVAIGFTGLMVFLRYDEKGETSMPFEVSKISVISVAEAQNIEDTVNRWNKNVELDNDVYIYINKNDEYKKTETIEKIEISNLKIIEETKRGETSIYKPAGNEKTFFENKEENKVSEITFLGGQSTKIEKLQISNQGGMIAFRVANQNLGNVVSNDDILEYKDLLKKIGITEEEIKSKISFDITIYLNKGKQFKATEVEVELPAGDTIENGKSSKEMTDLKLVFKRVEN